MKTEREPSASTVDGAGRRRDLVGPVLQRGAEARAVIAAIQLLNANVELLDRGAYIRVLVPERCRVTRQVVEKCAGRPFRLPGDLEAIMSSFKERFRVDDDEAIWELYSS